MTRTLAQEILGVSQVQLARQLYSHTRRSQTAIEGVNSGNLTQSTHLTGIACVSAGMAATGVLSPTKQGLQGMLSPSKQGLCSPLRQPLSPLLAKRSLSAVHGFHSSAVVTSSTSNSAHKRAQHVVASGAAASLASSGTGHSPATPSVAQQPTPAPGALSSCSTGQTHQQQHLQAGSTPSGASRLRPSSSCWPAAAGSQLQRTAVQGVVVDILAPEDQLPSPTSILEFPPDLQHIDGDDRLQASHSQWQYHHHHQKPVMSGRRVNSQFDIPLGLDWLASAPDHVAELGSGRLELIMGPMFAGKTTKLIHRVSGL